MAKRVREHKGKDDVVRKERSKPNREVPTTPFKRNNVITDANLRQLGGCIPKSYNY